MAAAASLSSSSSSQNEGNHQETKSGFQKTCKNYEEIIQTLPTEKGWWFVNLVQYQGFWLPSRPGLKGLLFIHDHFKSRPEDIILATSPKCGTTWLRSLIFAVMNRTSYDFSTHPLLTANAVEFVPFLESYIYQNDSTSHLDALPTPRLFSTHIPYTLFPPSIGCRIVYICREPKDVLVSKWHFAQKLRSKDQWPPLSFQDAFESFCKGVSHYGPYWDHVLSYWKASLEAPGKVLFLRYEDLKREPSVHVKKLAEFLGKPFSIEEQSKGVVEEIIQLCSFEKLSNLEVNTSTDSNYPVKNPDFFRKGEVGDWQNHLTLEMADRLDHITKEKFNGLEINF